VTELHELHRLASKRLQDHIEKHRQTPDVTLAKHIRYIQEQKANMISGKKLVYLDTLAWKCLADYKLKKPKLTDAMIMFAETFFAKAHSGQYVFPIAFPTFVELDALVIPETRAVLNDLVDEFSSGFCIVHQHERIREELVQLTSAQWNVHKAASDYLCSPLELMELSYPTLPAFVTASIDQNTFNKAWFDAMTELPMSAQLKVAATAPDEKWNNELGLTSLNEAKIKYQGDVGTLKQAIFVELKGCIEAWADIEGQAIEPKIVAEMACYIMAIWQSDTFYLAFPTLRVLSALHGSLRTGPNRRFKSGDLNDFSVAADALSICDVFLTDRRLANLISSEELDLGTLLGCQVIHGFEAMANYFS